MSPLDSREPIRSSPNETGRKRNILWIALFVALLMWLGVYFGVIAYVRFGGQVVKAFCSQELVGKSPSEAKELAARSGLEIVEWDGLIRVTTDPTMSRHTCDLKVDAGKVKSARAFFRF